MSKKLRGEFTFGFEFEGFGRLETYLRGTDAYDHYDEDFDCMECNSLDGDDYSEYYDSINHFINRCLGAKNGRTHYDGSVKNYRNGYQSFEYSSTVYKVNAKNFKKLNNFFSKLSNYDMGINETCGFHTHISYNGITEKDAIWIVSQIALNDEWVKEVTQMVDGDQTIDFYNGRYAEKDFLEGLKTAILNNEDVRRFINCDKYKVLRIHPQGTIEWRGPRNFLNRENGFMKFAKKLTNIIDIFSKALDMKTINGRSKEDFFKTITSTEECDYNGFKLLIPNCKSLKRHERIGLCQDFNINNIYHQHNTLNWGVINKLSESCDKNPTILFNKDLKPFFEYISNNLKSETVKKYVKLAEEKNDSFDENTIKSLLVKFAEILPMVAKHFDKFTLEEMMFYIDRINFHNLSEEDRDEIVKMSITHTDKKNIIDITNALLLSDEKTILSVLKLMKDGYYKGLDCTRICNLYAKSLSKSDNSINTVFKPLKDNDLIAYNENGIETANTSSTIINDLISNLEIATSNRIYIDTSSIYTCAETITEESNSYAYINSSADISR